MTQLTLPQVYNLRKDPYEKYDGAINFFMVMQKSWVLQPTLGLLRDHLASFKEFPPRQKGASLNVNEAIDKIMTSATRN